MAIEKKEDTTVSDINTALADINARAAQRKAASDVSQAKLTSDRIARRKTQKGQSGGTIQGLASLHNTLGRQYHKKTDSENS